MNQFKVTCEKYDIDKRLNKTFNKSQEFQLSNVQTFFPIMEKYYKMPNSLYLHYNLTLNSKYRLKYFINNEGLELSCDKGTENYKSYLSLIEDTYNKKKFSKKIFIKQSPIIDPLFKMKNQYTHSKHSSLLPYSSKYSKLQMDKINNINNSTYVDCFFTFLGSKLVENNISPNFPLYYGSYVGISKKYEFDISEEYEMYRNQYWFIKGLKKNKNNESNFYLHFPNEIDTQTIENKEDLEEDNNQKSEFEEKEIKEEINQKSEFEEKEIEEEFNQKSELEEEEILLIPHSLEKIDMTQFETLNLKNNEKNHIFDFRKNENDCMEETYKLNNEELTDIRQEIFNELDEMENIPHTDLSIKDNQEEEKEVYVILNDIPVQLICMEQCLNTLEDILEISRNKLSYLTNNEELKEELDEFIKKRDMEWSAYLLQICFALSVAQKHYDFVHNDLHSSNIMYIPTKDEYIYYKYNSKIYQIPTHGKILKIIDFGRATYKHNNIQYFSDMFEYKNEAGGQYTYPTDYHKSKNIVKPNKSFDLSRLSASIITDLFQEPPKEKENGCNLSISQKETESPLFNLLYSWIVDKYNKEILRFEEFNLYRMIARIMDNAVPEKQLIKPIFTQFIINQDKLNRKKGKLYYF